MAYRNKTYVAFDGDTDMWAYRYMRGWKQNDKSDFDFNDAHEIRQARDSSTEESIKRSLRERINSSRVFVLLVGEHTKNLYRFVRWEIEQAINLGLPIIVVNLNDKRTHDDALCPPILDNKLAVHISYNAKIMQHALEHWPIDHVTRAKNGEGSPCYYETRIYTQLGL
jgi:hypothetical protein